MRLFYWRIRCNVEALQRREQGVVDKVQQRITGQRPAGMIIHSPVLPPAFLRDDGFVMVLIELPVLFLGVVDLQKQHPGDLLNALGVTVDASVIPHNIPDPFYKCGKVAHHISLPCTVFINPVRL